MSFLFVKDFLLVSDITVDFPGIFDTLFEFFSSAQEDIKYAAAFALGNVSLGDVEKNLPRILSTIKENGQKRYLIFIALKEIISRLSSADAAPEHLKNVAPDIIALLFENTEAAQDDTIRNAISECLGKITLFDPATYLPQLKAKTTSPHENTRATVVIALRYTFLDLADQQDEFEAILTPMLPEFLALIGDADQVFLK